MRKRLVILAVTVLLPLTMTIPVLAQTPTPDPKCINLTDADCEFFKAALETMSELGSFNNKDFSLEISGSGGTSAGNSLALTGSGPMLLEDGRVNAAHLIVDGSLNDLTSPGEIIWLDDVLYAGVPEDGDISEWVGTPTDAPELEFFLEVLTGNLIITALQEPRVAVTLRGEDTELDGQAMAVYESDIDLISLLLAPSVLSTLENLMASLQPEPSEQQCVQQTDPLQDVELADALPFLAFILTRDTVRVVQWIGVEDKLVHHLEFTMDIELDATQIAPEAGTVTFQLELASDFDQHGEAFDITAPEDAVISETLFLDFAGIATDMLGSLSGTDVGQPEGAEPMPEVSPIAYGETVTGTLTSTNQQDTWEFEAQAGDTISVTVKSAVPNNMDPQVYVCDLENTQLAFNDDHTTERDDLAIFDALIEDFEIPADGTYHIVVTWLTETRDGDYELTLENDG